MTTWDDEPDYDDEPEDGCDHEEYSIDILTGRAECGRCLYAWWASNEQIAAYIRRHVQFAEWEAEQHRPWNRFKEWLRDHMPRLARRPPELDDGIPF